jgi:hypothetical protein
MRPAAPAPMIAIDGVSEPLVEDLMPGVSQRRDDVAVFRLEL